MKLKSALSGVLKPVGSLTLAAGAMAMMGATGVQAQPFTSPAGTTWDCVISGARSGIAFLAFTDDGGSGSISGYEIVVPRRIPHGQPNYTGIILPENPDLSARTNVFGFTFLSGQWGFNNKGRITGYITEGDDFFMIPVSFTARLRNNKLTLLERSSIGSVTLRGVPTNDVPELTGVWSALRSTHTNSTREFFTLQHFAEETNSVPDTNEAQTAVAEVNVDSFFTLSQPEFLGNPYAYFVQGGGAGATNVGIALISAQKRIGIVADVFSAADASFQVLRAVAGSFREKKSGSLLTGVEGADEPPSALTNRINFRIQRQSVTSTTLTP